MTQVTELIELASKHLGKGTMVSSAQLCYMDAMSLRSDGDYIHSMERALRSLSYSVGIFHADYQKAETILAKAKQNL